MQGARKKVSACDAVRTWPCCSWWRWSRWQPRGTGHVRRQLIGLLGLRECRFEYGMLLGKPPRIEPDGTVLTRYGHWPADESGLPEQEIELRAYGNGQHYGRLMMAPRLGSRPPHQSPPCSAPYS
jgi:hypothetical protein